MTAALILVPLAGMLWAIRTWLKVEAQDDHSPGLLEATHRPLFLTGPDEAIRKSVLNKF